MGCYRFVTNRLFLGYTGELSIEKASENVAKASSNMFKNWKLLSTGLHFDIFPFVSYSRMTSIV